MDDFAEHHERQTRIMREDMSEAEQKRLQESFKSLNKLREIVGKQLMTLEEYNHARSAS